METKFFSGLFEGDSPNGVKLGMGLTGGDFWPRTNMCHTVYRGQDGDLDSTGVLAVMELEDELVAINNQFLPPNTIWHFVRCQASDCGLESDPSPICIVRIDENGDMIGDMPNLPIPLFAQQVAGGKLRLRWRYSPTNQEIAPTSFKVYMDSGSGFDYGTPVDTVSYDLGKAGEFDWLSPALTHGHLYRFVVRSDHASEAETRNTQFVSAIADSVGPPAITGIRTSLEDI